MRIEVDIEGNITEHEDAPIIERTTEEVEAEILSLKIQEANQYLNKTDHKFYNGYKPKEDEDLAEIEILRDEAREFIRTNKGEVTNG